MEKQTGATSAFYYTTATMGSITITRQKQKSEVVRWEERHCDTPRVAFWQNGRNRTLIDAITIKKKILSPSIIQLQTVADQRPPTEQWAALSHLSLSLSLSPYSLPPICLVNPAVRWGPSEVSGPRRVTPRFPSIIHRAAAASAPVFNSPDDHIIPPPKRDGRTDGRTERGEGDGEGKEGRKNKRG